nr:MAG TPA: hypothetical protein [Caudoviricetes sp.]
MFFMVHHRLKMFIYHADTKRQLTFLRLALFIAVHGVTL